MMKHTLFSLVAAVVIATAGTVSAMPGDALACSFRLGETCGQSEDAAKPFGGPALVLPGIGSRSATVPAPAETLPGNPTQVAGGGCGAAAASAAAAQGGQVIGAPRTVQQGNRTMCVVTVLIKDPTGQRPPTRRQITVPAN